jgi:hypothetical protein
MQDEFHFHSNATKHYEVKGYGFLAPSTNILLAGARCLTGPGKRSSMIQLPQHNIFPTFPVEDVIKRPCPAPYI